MRKFIEIIEALKSFAHSKPEIKMELKPFQYSSELDDGDEENVNFTSDIFPARADIPSPSSQVNLVALEAWRNKCTVLISGINIPIGMTYIDAKGDETKRKIDVKKIFRSGDLDRYFTGFCYLRVATRTFREGRIQEIIELRTGEVIQPKIFFDRYGIFGGAKMEELQIIIHILLYLARADRSFIDAEKTVLSEVIGQYCTGHQKELIEEYAFNHRLQKQDYLNEVSRLRFMDRAVVSFLLAKAEELISVDGKITQKEREFFNILKQDGHSSN